MDSIRVFCDSIKNVVNVSCKCAEVKSECPTNWENVVIVGIIAVTACLVVYWIIDTVKDITKMKKHDGIKAIVEEILEDKEKQNKKNVE